jgi:hypothetical protein
MWHNMVCCDMQQSFKYQIDPYQELYDIIVIIWKQLVCIHILGTVTCVVIAEMLSLSYKLKFLKLL